MCHLPSNRPDIDFGNYLATCGTYVEGLGDLLGGVQGILEGSWGVLEVACCVIVVTGRYEMTLSEEGTLLGTVLRIPNRK